MTSADDDTGVAPDLTYSDGIAAARTMLALRADPTALQKRLGASWELAPYAGDDIRGTALRDANVLVAFHEVYAAHSAGGGVPGVAQVSYVVFVSQARSVETGELGHVHWFTYTEDPGAVPGRYNDAVLADVTRSQTFTKQRRGETQVQEAFSAVGADGEVHLTLSYDQGGDWLLWTTSEEPNLALYAARDPSVTRVYQEDQVLNVARSLPLDIDRVSQLTLQVKGELADVFDGSERVIAVVIQRPYILRVFVPGP